MHDIDRALFESEYDGSGEAEEFTFPGPSELDEFEFDQEAGDLHESEGEDSLVTELMEISDEAELDQFLGNLIRRAAPAVRKFARSDTGRALGGILKTAARQALPHVGRAVGNWVAPGIGGAVGKRVGKCLSSQFELGLELEGLSAEDQEYETARTFVQFAQDAARRAAKNAASEEPAAAARNAVLAAARQHLPGLAQEPKPKGTRRGHEGRWVRRGNRIVLLDV